VAAAAVARRFATAKKALIKRVADLTHMHNIKYKKNLKMWKYFKKECKEYFKNGEVSARNYQSIYNYIISNKDDSINYLTHFNFTNADINKLNDIALYLEIIKQRGYAGGGKKPKFIQSGGTISQDDADEVFWHGLIEYDEPDMNSVSFLLPKFLEISDFLNAPFTNGGEEKKLDDLCSSFNCTLPDDEEVKQFVSQEDGYRSAPLLLELVNSLATTINTDLRDIKQENEKFYMNLLEDIYNNMNYKFGGLDRNEVVACVSSDLTILTDEEIEKAATRSIEGATHAQQPHVFRIYKNPRKPSDEDLEQVPDLLVVSDSDEDLEQVPDLLVVGDSDDDGNNDDSQSGSGSDSDGDNPMETVD